MVRVRYRDHAANCDYHSLCVLRWVERRSSSYHTQRQQRTEKSQNGITYHDQAICLLISCCCIYLSPFSLLRYLSLLALAVHTSSQHTARHRQQHSTVVTPATQQPLSHTTDRSHTHIHTHHTTHKQHTRHSTAALREPHTNTGTSPLHSTTTSPHAVVHHSRTCLTPHTAQLVCHPEHSAQESVSRQLHQIGH